MTSAIRASREHRACSARSAWSPTPASPAGRSGPARSNGPATTSPTRGSPTRRRATRSCARAASRRSSRPRSIHREVVVGAITVYGDRPDAFDAEADAALLGALADQAAVAIANARLIDELERSRAEIARRADSERTLREIAARVSAILEPAEVLQQIVDEATRLLESDGARIDLYDPEIDALRWSYAAGDAMAGRPRVGPDGRPQARPGGRRDGLRRAAPGPDRRLPRPTNDSSTTIAAARVRRPIPGSGR